MCTAAHANEQSMQALLDALAVLCQAHLTCLLAGVLYRHANSKDSHNITQELLFVSCSCTGECTERL